MTDFGNKEQMETVRDAVETGVNTTVRNFQKVTDQFTQAVGFAGPQAEELGRRSTQNIEAVARASTILVKGAQEISREWFQVMQERLSKNLEAISRLTSCRSMHGSPSASPATGSRRPGPTRRRWRGAASPASW